MRTLMWWILNTRSVLGLSGWPQSHKPDCETVRKLQLTSCTYICMCAKIRSNNVVYLFHLISQSLHTNTRVSNVYNGSQLEDLASGCCIQVSTVHACPAC